MSENTDIYGKIFLTGEDAKLALEASLSVEGKANNGASDTVDGGVNDTVDGGVNDTVDEAVIKIFKELLR